MSRRLRTPRTRAVLFEVFTRLQRGRGPGDLLVVDGKAFPLRRHTRDPDAARGRGVGGMVNGDKLLLMPTR